MSTSDFQRYDNFPRLSRLQAPVVAPTAHQRVNLVAAGITFGALVVFLFARGIYLPRLAFNLVPPVLAPTAAIVVEVTRGAPRGRPRLLAALTWAAILARLAADVTSIDI